MRHLTKLVTVTVVAIVSLALFFQAWVLYESHERALLLIETRAANRAQSTADRINAVFSRLDSGLLAIRDEINADEVINGPTLITRNHEKEMQVFLKRWQERMPKVQRVHVISANGRFVYSNLDPVPSRTIDDRMYFKEQLEANEDRFRLSEVYFSRVGHEWGLLVSRRLMTREGKFAGIIVFTIPAKSLESEMTAVDQSQWFFAAFDKNLMFVASNPLRDQWYNRTFSDRFLKEGLEQGRSVAQGQALGLESKRIWSACKVGEFPILMVAGYLESVALGQWWRDLKLNLLVAGLLVSGCITILIFQRQNDRANRHICNLHERMSLATNSARLGVWEWDINEDRAVCDETTAQLLQLPSGEGTYSPEVLFKNLLPEDWINLQEITAHIGITFLDERIRISLQGDVIHYLECSGIIQGTNDSGGRRVVGVIRDVTESKKATLALQLSEERYRQITKCVPDVIWTMDLFGRFTYVNSAVERTHGWTVEEFLRLSFRDVAAPQQVVKNEAMIEEEIKRATQPGYDRSIVHIFQSEELRKDGSTFWAEISGTFLWNESGEPIGLIGITRDISERKKVEDEKEKLQEQLVQSQKMESIGKLAGGVAHDFNNMLTAIQGNADLALMQLPPESPIANRFQAIRDLVKRSADLTGKLLAFARKQPIEPRVLDINLTIESMLAMVKRLIGENIKMIWKPSDNLWLVKADPSQIDQIFVNLCVNARDAINGEGKIVVETQNCTIDSVYCTTHAGLQIGDYVHLSVSDDGCGMDKELVSHIFEPFFTTKGLGKGTGLGLATVYGSVKQNKGFINVYSEPGEGSRFSIYLPKYNVDEEGDQNIIMPAISTGGSETILLVEDESAILETTTAVLEQLGYTVLAQINPLDALKLANESPMKIDLLLTDVIMPEMNGRVLAEKLLNKYPKLKCLFMSGYTDDIVAPQDILEQGFNFIQKPFTHTLMAEKIRQVLDTKTKPEG